MKKTFTFLAALFLFINSSIAQPCTGTPVAGTVYFTPSSVCNSSLQPIQFIDTGFSVGSGISMQWQNSVCSSSSGPWLIIAGATSNILMLYPPFSPGCLEYNVLVYCANNGQFDVSNSVSFSYQSPLNCKDSVWPGDVNYDHIVNNADALDLAIAMSAKGSSRASASINYLAQFSVDWTQSFATGVNFKNADCDGDDSVTINDITAITTNFGLTHPKGAETPKAKISGNPDLYFDVSGITFTQGINVSVPIKLGNAAVPMTKLYGLAADIKVNGINLSVAPTITYTNSWIGNTSNTLQFSKDLSPNHLAWAYSRIDHHNVSGNGTIAYLNFAIPPASAGQAILKFENVKMIDSTGKIDTNYNVLSDTVNIVPVGIVNTTNEISSAQVIPNPSAGEATLLLAVAQTESVTISIVDLAGKMQWTKKVSMSKGENKIALPVASLASGVYLIALQTQQGAKHKLRWVKE